MNTTVGAKRILIYGDSFTWGRVANKTERFDEATRYPCVVQQELGSGYEVVEEGLRGRTVKGENPFTEGRDGLAQFGPILCSHLPLDLLVIFLGTNDTNRLINKQPEEIAAGLHDYFAAIPTWAKTMDAPEPSKVLIIAPPHVKGSVLKTNSMFEGAQPKSEALGALYQAVAREHGALFFDAAKAVTACDEDGVHLDAQANIALGKALANFIKQNLS